MTGADGLLFVLLLIIFGGRALGHIAGGLREVRTKRKAKPYTKPYHEIAYYATVVRSRRIWPLDNHDAVVNYSDLTEEDARDIVRQYYRGL
jgi:hypothetical protein